jgi:hypothetical protein
MAGGTPAIRMAGRMPAVPEDPHCNFHPCHFFESFIAKKMITPFS